MRGPPPRGLALWSVGLRSRVARGFDIQSHRATPRWVCLGIISTGIPRRLGCGICTGGHTIRSTLPSQRSTRRTRGAAGHCETRFMVQWDLLCPFPRALCDFPYSVHLKRVMLTHRIEVPSVPDKSRFVGLYLERGANALSGLGLGVCYRRPCR